MKQLVFAFTSCLPEVPLRPGLRTSVWVDDAPDYTMPCEFQQVTEDTAPAHVRVLALDPAGRVSARQVNGAFSFGHLGRIVGHGQLLAVMPEGE